MKNLELYRNYDPEWLSVRGMMGRSEGDSEKIVKRALELGGNETWAKWLMRMVIYRHAGRTWGESLWCADDQEEMYWLESVMETLEETACIGRGGFIEDIVEEVSRNVLVVAGEGDLYLMMAEDLAGKEGLDRVLDILQFKGLRWTTEELQAARSKYERVVGRTIAEWQEADLVEVFTYHLAALTVIEEKLEELGDQDGWTVIDAARMNASFGAKETLKEIFSRGLVAEGVDLKNEGENPLNYADACELWEILSEEN